MLWRGARRRCAWCGGRGAFFTGWFARSERCHTCGLAWRRGDVGYELGAMTINTIATFGALLAAVVVAALITAPGVSSAALVGVGLVTAIVVPVVLYPVSYTLWQAVDLRLRPPSDADFGEPGDA
jgi:uncharacterized protein (DUF983 family)